ncbi:fructosamine kinase family protein [Aquimarina sp. M1]
MLSKKLIAHIENRFSEKITTLTPLSGGDINEVFILELNTRKLVVKLNSATSFPVMFEAEVKGLQELRKATIFTIPKVLHYGKYEEDSFLLLEYIETGKQTSTFWTVFGQKLADLHKISSPYFGFESDNYIGSLPQYNMKHTVASEFYISQRLQPQFKMAVEKGFAFKNLDMFYATIETEIPKEISSLIHGDLWNGNFMVDAKGAPCLLDPAVAYAPREMDIAMMHLFGGFDQELFASYNEIFPLIDGWKPRLEIWQLYYLLVHLNLFGDSYLPKIQFIIRKYS